MTELPSPSFVQNKHPWYRRVSVWIIVGMVLTGGVIFFLPQAPRSLTNSATVPVGGETKWSGAQPQVVTPVVNVISKDAPSQGSPVAPVVIVEFGDFQCPFCRQAAPILDQLLQKYPEAVQLSWKNFPLSDVHPEAIAAAEAAMCAAKQGKFWAYHDALYNNQDALDDTLYQSLASNLGLNLDQFTACRQGHLTLPQIQTDFTDGATAGVQGTPTFFVNGHKFAGVLSFDLWNTIVTGVLKAKFGIK